MKMILKDCIKLSLIKLMMNSKLLEQQKLDQPLAFVLLKKKIVNFGLFSINCHLDNTTVYVANIGDTRAVLISLDGVERITVDHKATDPKEILRVQLISNLLI